MKEFDDLVRVAVERISTEAIRRLKNDAWLFDKDVAEELIATEFASLREERERTIKELHDAAGELSCPHVNSIETMDGKAEAVWLGALVAKQYRENADRNLSTLRAENERLRNGLTTQNDAVCQTLGKALGYPRYCDDQENFPGATEANGVCVGEHVAESLASEMAAKYVAVRERCEAATEFEDKNATVTYCRWESKTPWAVNRKSDGGLHHVGNFATRDEAFAAANWLPAWQAQEQGKGGE